jgi:hypothetical protein
MKTPRIPRTGKAKWLIFSVTGLLLTGFGLSLAIDAGMNKFSNDPWIAEGTIALIIFNTGLSVFGKAIAEFVWLKRDNL